MRIQSATRALGAATVLALGLSACVSSRMIAADSFVAPQRLDAQGSKEAGLRVTVHHLILPEAPGSWVREATWVEYELTLSNDGAEPVTVYSLELGTTLARAPVHTTQLAVLEDEGRANARFYRSLGTGFAWPGAATAVAAVSAGSFAGAAIAIIALPVVAIGGGVYVYRRAARDREDLELVQQELDRRGLAMPLAIAPKSSVKGSAFFPLAIAPSELLVNYRQGAAVRALTVGLPQPGRP